MINRDVLDGLLENRKPEFKTLGTEADIVIVPEGMKVESLKSIKDSYKTKPERRKGLINAFDRESFSAIVTRFKGENSALFQKAYTGDNKFDAELRAVLNYHPAGADNTAADNRDHSAVYSFPLSDELKVWLAKNKQPFNSKEFAEFLEDNIADLVIPKPEAFVTKFGDDIPSFASPSSIMTLSRGIDVRVNEKVTQAFRVADGTFNLQYTTENSDSSGSPLRLPEWFALGIPVFQNGAYYQVPMRLRFRVKEGQVAWFFEMYRKNDIFNTAFNKDCALTQTETGLPLYNGSPE